MFCMASSDCFILMVNIQITFGGDVYNRNYLLFWGIDFLY